MDHEPVRDEGPVGGGQTFALHGSFDAALELDRLDARMEETCRWSLE
jgi:hypothetical protein